MTTMTNSPEILAEQAHPWQWRPTEQKFWGGADNPEYPVPAEILHLSVFHQGPGVDELIHFYQTVLNLRYVWKTDYGFWEFIALSHDDENHRIGIVNAYGDYRPHAMELDSREEYEAPEGTEPRELPQRPCRLEHMNWRFETFEDILKVAKRTHDELGIWPMTTRLSPFDFTIDYLDPDLNRVEMLAQFAPTKGTALFGMFRGLERMMGTRGDYDRIYLPVSMEKMLDHYEAGVPLETLRSRPWAEQQKADGKL